MRKFLVSSSSATVVAPRRSLSRRCLSSSPADTTVIDRELQSSYEGLVPRLLTLQKLLDVKGRSDFFKLHKQGVVSQESPITAMAIYADLQNPLLTKYKFDAQDFMVGAKEAFKQVHMTIASADFFNYSNGFGGDIKTDQLLQVSLHPKLYTACKEACKEMHDKEIQTHMTGIKVLSTNMVRITTHIHESEPSPSAAANGPLNDAIASAVNNLHTQSPPVTPTTGSQESVTATSSSSASSSSTSSSTSPSSDDVCGTSAFITPAFSDGPPVITTPTGGSGGASENTHSSSGADATVQINSSDASVASTPSPSPSSSSQSASTLPQSSSSPSSSSSSSSPLPPSSSPSPYPVGAVIATVDVAYEAEEEYDSKLADGSRISTKRTTSTQWAFRGCISGQQALDWQITGFNGYGFQ